MKTLLLRHSPGSRHRVVVGILAGVAAVTLMVAPAAAANAATPSPSAPTGTTSTTAATPLSSFHDCPVNDLCWWEDRNQVGPMHPVRDAIFAWTTQTLPIETTGTCGGTTWDDCASTLYNNRAGFGAQVYSEPYPKGGSPSNSDPGFCLQPGSQMAFDLTKVHYSNEVTLSLNDTISANRWRTGGC
jgi:hypothetical protein